MEISDNIEDKIINMAKTVFIEKGYAETSMSDIAVRVGINRPGLHYYFRTKDKLFQAVFGEIVLTIVPKVFDILTRKEYSLSERIEGIVDAYYSLFKSNPRLPMFIIREMNRDAKLLINTATKLNMPEQLRIAIASINEEMEQGKIRKIPLRFLFYNLYGLLTMPFLTQDMTRAVFLENGESFDQVLTEWKPYIIDQMTHLLTIKN